MFPFDIPKTYSEMLNKIGICAFAVALICTIIAGHSSAEIDRALHFAKDAKVNLGVVQLDGLPLGYVLIPAVIAFISRFLKLHDRLSDLFGIRSAYDVEYILAPLAKGVGANVDSTLRRKLTVNRDSLMYDIFYPYAGYAKPQIDENIVLQTLDSLTWFWILVEATFLVISTVIVLFLAKRPVVSVTLICVSTVLFFVSYALYRVCVLNTAAEVREILKDPARVQVIRGKIDAL